MTKLELLQKHLSDFGSKLTVEQCKEFRAILDEFAQLHYEFGETYKLALITLIPSKTAVPAAPTTTSPTPSFKPATSLRDIAMSLATNLQNKLGEKE